MRVQPLKAGRLGKMGKIAEKGGLFIGQILVYYQDLQSGPPRGSGECGVFIGLQQEFLGKSAKSNEAQGEGRLGPEDVPRFRRGFQLAQVGQGQMLADEILHHGLLLREKVQIQMGKRHVLHPQQFVVHKGGDPQGHPLLAQFLQFQKLLVSCYWPFAGRRKT